MLSQGAWLEDPPEYFVQHLSVYLPLLFQQRLMNIAVLDRNR
jgi:hypothetical protein